MVASTTIRTSGSTRTTMRNTANVTEADMGPDVYGYIAPPGTVTPHRDVLKWVQSLDLAHSLKDSRRDLANGFYVAQIFSRYFPSKVQMHSFENGHSSATKRDNWGQIQRFCNKWQSEPLPEDLVEDTIEGMPGAGVLLLQHLFELLTGKKVQQRPPSPPPEPEDEPEEPKRKPIAPIAKKGRDPKEDPAHAQEDPSKPKNYGILGSKPVGKEKTAKTSAVEFGKAGKIQLGEVTDVQELRRKLRAA